MLSAGAPRWQGGETSSTYRLGFWAGGYLPVKETRAWFSGHVKLNGDSYSVGCVHSVGRKIVPRGLESRLRLGLDLHLCPVASTAKALVGSVAP